MSAIFVRVHDEAGFTLLEVLLSLVIIAVGLLAVYRPLLSATATMDHMDKRSAASYLMSDQLSVLQQKVSLYREAPPARKRGQIPYGKWTFDYDIQSLPVQKAGGLYEAKFDVSWPEGGRRKHVSRSTYVLVPPKE